MPARSSGKTIGFWLKEQDYLDLIERMKKDGAPVKPRSAAAYVKRHVIDCILGSDGRCHSIQTEMQKEIAPPPAINEPEVPILKNTKNGNGNGNGKKKELSPESDEKNIEDDEPKVKRKMKAKLGLLGL